MYADEAYYVDEYGGNIIAAENLKGYLNKAAHQIDTLTYCRIKGIEFDNLSDFQKEQIKYVNCMLAEFLYENEDELETILSSYAINGVSMTFGNGETLLKVNGIFIRTDIYSELVKTGLCCRRI